MTIRVMQSRVLPVQIFLRWRYNKFFQHYCRDSVSDEQKTALIEKNCFQITINYSFTSNEHNEHKKTTAQMAEWYRASVS